MYVRVIAKQSSDNFVTVYNGISGTVNAVGCKGSVAPFGVAQCRLINLAVQQGHHDQAAVV